MLTNGGILDVFNLLKTRALFYFVAVVVVVAEGFEVVGCGFECLGVVPAGSLQVEEVFAGVEFDRLRSELIRCQRHTRWIVGSALQHCVVYSVLYRLNFLRFIYSWLILSLTLILK